MGFLFFFPETLNPWIGLKAESNTEFFKWEDGTNASFTYWARNQPAVLKPNTTNCVVLSDLVCGPNINDILHSLTIVYIHTYKTCLAVPLHSS